MLMNFNEKYCVNIVESIVRGKKWQNMLDLFYRTNSPRFQCFPLLVTKINNGEGTTLSSIEKRRDINFIVI